MLKHIYIIILGTILAAGISTRLHAQNPARQLQNATSRFTQGGPAGASGDSLLHRTGLEDSITIRFRFIDSSRFQLFDSSVKDFTQRFPVPWYYVTLGNFGTAAENRLFSPQMKSGWDHGFHALDIYNFTLAETKFYNTTRPFTDLNYVVGSVAEQMIQILHTQNVKPNWNVAFQYRLIFSPGTFQNQNTAHSNYRLTSWYQSKNKRYQNFFVILGNKLTSGENGGIKGDNNYLDSSTFTESRFNIPTQLGKVQDESRNFFGTSVGTGTFYTNATYLMRQQYDLGQKDSIVVNDSTVVPLFYPRVRFEHTISYNTYKYRFDDKNANSQDTNYYSRNYDIDFPDRPDTFYRRDYWKELLNDFSIYQFPDAKNSQQFIKVGASFQVLKGDFDTGLVKNSYTNLWLHGEYRNKTRDRKWDIEAYGSFYLSGLNAGDYNAHFSLKRLITDRIGFLQVGFENTNRKPSFVFDTTSSFFLDQPVDLNKENSTHFFGALEQPRQRLRISGDYYIISNYTYLRDYYKVAQASALFNVLRINVEKDFKLGHKGWHWRTWVVFQQKIGDAELNLPLITTRNQIAYDGNLGFKNLLISLGFEIRYFTPYKANNYSPLQGQFFYQDEVKISMRSPELSTYVHFRIKRFTNYLRIENLNAFSFKTGRFSGNNVLLPNYPSPGFQIKVGVFWTFVN